MPLSKLLARKSEMEDVAEIRIFCVVRKLILSPELVIGFDLFLNWLNDFWGQGAITLGN